MSEKMIQVNFRMPEKEYRRLRSVAISCKLSITGILQKLIRENLDKIQKEDLVERLKGIDPIERLSLVHALNEEEKEMAKGKAASSRKKRKKLKKETELVASYE